MKQTTSTQAEIARARRGDSLAFEILFAPVRPYARMLARRYFVPGWEREDLYQEALAGFAAALVSFEAERGCFQEYAQLCMRNNVVATVRHATRQKRAAGHASADLDALGQAASNQFRPDLLVEQQVECDELLMSLKGVLSSAEWTVLQAVMAGLPLAEVASTVGANQRYVENALSRARVKARRLLHAA